MWNLRCPDGTASDSVSFVWTIAGVNQAPSVTNPGNQSHSEGENVSLPVNATDPDGDALTFGASGLPPGLSIQPANGQISGVVSTAGSYSVAVTVNDGNGGSDTVSFSWTVGASILLDAPFDADAEGFVYEDDSFRGTTPALVCFRYMVICRWL